MKLIWSLSWEGDEEDDVIDDAERHIERLVNGLRIVLFCKFILFFLPDNFLFTGRIMFSVPQNISSKVYVQS